MDDFFYDETDSIDLKENNMLSAFTITDLVTDQLLNDENLIEWKAFFVTSTGNPQTEEKTPLGIHPCQ